MPSASNESSHHDEVVMTSNDALKMRTVRDGHALINFDEVLKD